MAGNNNYLDYQYILLNVTGSPYYYNFHPKTPLQLGPGAEIGLKSLFMWYTYPNVSPKYNNDTVSVNTTNSNGWLQVKIPEGMYEVKALEETINRETHIATGGNINDKAIPQIFKFQVNESTFKCTVKVPPQVKIDFSQSKLHELLGLEPKEYSAFSDNEGKDIINISRGVDRLLIRCNLVDRSYQNEWRDVLYDLLPYAQPGAAIQILQGDNIEFHPCRDGVIRRLEIRVTDSQNNPVHLKEDLVLKLAFRSNRTQQKNNVDLI